MDNHGMTLSWYKKTDVILPGKVVGLIEVDKEIKFVIHSAIVEDGFDGVSTMQKSFLFILSLEIRITSINMILGIL